MTDWIIINTPELKALFAPTQDRDEIQFGDNQGWYPIGGQHYGCSFGSANYRRLASRAWLSIAKSVGASHPCHWAALWILHKDGTKRWATKWIDGLENSFTHWLPAPPAPEGPRDEDEEAWRAAMHKTLEVCHAGSTVIAEKVAKDIFMAGRDYERSKK